MRILKNILIPILAAGMILTAGGCSKKEEPEEVIQTCIFESSTAYTPTTITVEELQEKITNSDDFVLLVSDDFCTACREFKNNVLPAFLQYYCVKTYEITAVELNKIGGTKNEIIPYHATPTLGVFIDGKLADKQNYMNSDNRTVNEIFKTYTKIWEYLTTPLNKESRYVESGIAVDEAMATQLINSDTSFLIYYKRDTCGDCRFFSDNFLKQTAIMPISNTATEFDPVFGRTTYYVFDINEHYLARDPELGAQDPEWMAFTAKFGLSSLEYGGTAKGWQRGVVPTFQYRKKGQVVDASVVFNDLMTFNNGITITGSYYEDSPFVGSTFENYNEYQNETMDFFVEKTRTLFIEYNSK